MPPVPASTRLPPALLALALATFAIDTTEFVVAGLLPLVAADYGISVSMAGNLLPNGVRIP